MIPLEEFRKTLPTDREFTEEEVLKLRDTMDGLANAFFDQWLRKKNDGKD